MTLNRLILLGLILVMPSVEALSKSIERKPLSYGIFRNGDEIGSARTTFRREGDRLVVETAIKIVVKIAFVSVYRQEELKREYWRNGVMVEYTADLDKNGEKVSVRAKQNGVSLETQGPAGRTKAPIGLIPSTYWNSDTVRQTRLLDSTTGAVVNVTVSPNGSERIKTGNGAVQARRYRMTGDLDRELWYDESGALVALKFTESSGGSTIEYRRK